mmetsp:Transcript_73735/g.192371  ORF Transcript_73735/g.192371 Transcript_73735/m.192371 type:complete len:211 (-) Transcript_73735:27-659(-)
MNPELVRVRHDEGLPELHGHRQHPLQEALQQRRLVLYRRVGIDGRTAHERVVPVPNDNDVLWLLLLLLWLRNRLGSRAGDPSLERRSTLGAAGCIGAAPSSEGCRGAQTRMGLGGVHGTSAGHHRLRRNAKVAAALHGHSPHRWTSGNGSVALERHLRSARRPLHQLRRRGAQAAACRRRAGAPGRTMRLVVGILGGAGMSHARRSTTFG